MKRSREIRLVLLGGLSLGALGGCNPKPGIPPPPAPAAAAAGADSPDRANVFTNDYRVPELGYYHAPFRAWYPLPYNHYSQERRQYYYGGTWADAPWQSITNLSTPLPPEQPAVHGGLVVITGGFGGTGSGHIVGG